MTGTAVAPMVNDPRLEFSAEDHRYTLDGRELISVTTALRLAGMVDVRFFTEYARARGDLLHRCIFLYAQNDLDLSSVDPVLLPYFDAFRKFLDESGFEFEMVERRVCDPSIGVAGTLDAIGIARKLRGAPRLLADWKSGSFPPAAGPQTAGYLRCARWFYPTGTLIQRAGLQLRGDGTYRLHLLHDIVQDEADFMSALRVSQFILRHGIAA